MRKSTKKRQCKHVWEITTIQPVVYQYVNGADQIVPSISRAYQIATCIKCLKSKKLEVK